VTWVKGLKCFEALLSVEVLLDLDIATEESRLKDFMSNLVPFAALKCERITFRGPPYVQDSTMKDVEVAWQEALEAEQTEVFAKVPGIHLISHNLADHSVRLRLYGITSIRDQEKLWKLRQCRINDN
jgi:hypothetical protein